MTLKCIQTYIKLTLYLTKIGIYFSLKRFIKFIDTRSERSRTRRKERRKRGEKEGSRRRRPKGGCQVATLTQFYFFRCIRPCAENDAIEVVTARHLKFALSLSRFYIERMKKTEQSGVEPMAAEAEEKSRPTSRIVRTFIVAAAADLTLWCARSQDSQPITCGKFVCRIKREFQREAYVAPTTNEPNF